MKPKDRPLWEKCLGCGDWLCTLHTDKDGCQLHVYDCECADIDFWSERNLDPYDPKQREECIQAMKEFVDAQKGPREKVDFDQNGGVLCYRPTESPVDGKLIEALNEMGGSGMFEMLLPHAGEDEDIWFAWFRIDNVPPSLNQWSREHWSVRHEAARAWKLIVKQAAKRCFIRPQGTAVVSITFVARKDADNMAKFVVDGLVSCGMLKDDGPEGLDVLLLRTVRPKKGIKPFTQVMVGWFNDREVADDDA